MALNYVLNTEITAMQQDLTDLIDAERMRAESAESGLQAQINNLTPILGAISQIMSMSQEMPVVLQNIVQLQTQYNHLANQILAINGQGQWLNAHDFGVAAPTDEQLLEYAFSDIWGAGGVFIWDENNPSASTYEINGTTHTGAEIFNGTRVKNLFDDQVYILANTQDTTPPVFTWADIGTLNLDNVLTCQQADKVELVDNLPDVADRDPRTIYINLEDIE